jgi:hypothetical protein
MEWWIICLIWIGVSFIAGLAFAQMFRNGSGKGLDDDNYPD